VMGEEKSADLNKMLWTVCYSYTIKELKIYYKIAFPNKPMKLQQFPVIRFIARTFGIGNLLKKI
jgi:hypothetical protein